MRCIARNGLSGTTLAQVTREAGLSLGSANLHFESKEKLLVATLLHVTEEYNRGQQAILESGRFATTAARIEAILQFDFSSQLTTREKLAVWFAFWGEARSRPTYQRICSQTDVKAQKAISALFKLAIDEAGSRDVDAALIAAGYTAMVDGLWLDMLLAPQRMKRDQALAIARDYLASAFPSHVTPESKLP